MSIYDDGQDYDGVFGRYASGDELDFYKRLVARYGQPVLELACGTGRLAVSLAECGVAIVGLDRAETMLRVARAKAMERDVDATFQQGDMRQFNLNRQFNLIFIATNSIMHLHQESELADCFACVRRHLTRDGRFFIDIFNPSFAILSRDAAQRYPVGQYVDGQGKRVVVTENNRYDTATQINHIRHYYQRAGEPEVMRAFALRQFFPREIDTLLTQHGFMIEAKYGNFAETPFGDGARKQLIVCRAG